MGKLPSTTYEMPLLFKEDGTVKEIFDQDKECVKEFNESILKIKGQLTPVIDFISQVIFENQKVISQELVIHKEDNILALCDLSTPSAILEIKTNYNANAAFMYRNQLFYEANGRKCFLLQIDWSRLPDIFAIEIIEVHLSLGERPHKDGRRTSIETVQARIDNEDIDVIRYTGRASKVALKCNICGHKWQVTYHVATNHPKCPLCEPQKICKKKEKMSDEERKERRDANYKEKLLHRSNGNINAHDYAGAKDSVSAECLNCGYGWKIRADRLLERPYCPKCKVNKGG